MANLKVESFLKELYRLEVEFVIIGGMAAVAQGSAYLTVDLDLCYLRKKQNLEKLAQALAPFHPLLRGVPTDLPFSLDVSALKSGLNFTLTTDLGDLDLLGEVAGLGTPMFMERDKAERIAKRTFTPTSVERAWEHFAAKCAA